MTCDSTDWEMHVARDELSFPKSVIIGAVFCAAVSVVLLSREHDLVAGLIGTVVGAVLGGAAWILDRLSRVR